ncbi:hypothetical protein Dimus_023498 [Dionaea muscipula]
MAAAGNFNMLIGITCSLVAVLLRLASAETVHVVGGTTGWTFPSSTSVYSDWVATQKFQVGDILEFNFPTGEHSVATVSKSDYVACNTASPLALQTTGPVNITVKSGTQYFICTYPGHCAAGQKLAVVAAAAASPPSTPPSVAPTPSSPSPAPASGSRAPAPVPSIGSKSPKKAPKASVHVVGGTTGWTFPSSTSVYSNWVATQKFQVGDILEFNFPTGEHSVATVSKADYVACNTASPLALQTTGPVNITVKSGTQYFICTYPGHCAAGQKLAVVAATASSPPSTPPAVALTPSSSSPAPTSRSHAPAPAPSTASKSPKKAPEASPSVTPTASPTASSTTPITATPPTASTPSSGGSGAVIPPSPTTTPSSAPPAAVAGVFLSLLSIAVAILC